MVHLCVHCVESAPGIAGPGKALLPTALPSLCLWVQQTTHSTPHRPTMADLPNPQEGAAARLPD